MAPAAICWESSGWDSSIRGCSVVVSIGLGGGGIRDSTATEGSKVEGTAGGGGTMVGEAGGGWEELGSAGGGGRDAGPVEVLYTEGGTTRNTHRRRKLRPSIKQ